MMVDPRGFPDSIGLGPFGPSDEQARRLVLGLDVPASQQMHETAASAGPPIQG
jgi:hypothetical protein